jgi:Putative metal-binding motif/Right handed beta helix region
MFSRKSTLWSMALCLSILLAACTLPTPTPTATPATAPLTLYVATTGNDSNDCLSEATACLTVYGANRKSTPGSTINIGAGVFTEAYTSAGFQHDLTLQGAGRDLTVLNSDTNNVVVHVTRPAHITIRALTVGHGGGTYPMHIGVDMVAGSSVTLQDCRVRNNEYDGVRNYGTRLTIQNCIIEGNETGIENHGDLVMSDSQVNNNQSGLANGGSAQIDNTTFDGNGFFDTTSYAGSITLLNGPGATLTMQGGGISHSHAFSIINREGTASLTGVAVHDNEGSGIWQESGNVTISSVIIQNNQGYGVAIGGRTGVDPGVLNISQTAIVGNHSAGLRIDDGEIHVQNTTISGNFASSVSSGGGIWGYGGNLFLLDSTVAYNTGMGLQLGVGELAPGVVTIRRSVIALNSAQECEVDSRVSFPPTGSPFVCSESWTPATLKLNPLTVSAGTLVHTIDADSPLVDAAGPLASCPTLDQRGYGRPGGATCDVGAYERNGVVALAPVPLFITTLAPIQPPNTPALPPTPAASPTPSMVMLVLHTNANCRRGPGSVYSVLTSFLAGQSLQIDGRNGKTPWWWRVVLPNSSQHCWISDAAGTPDGEPNSLPVIPAPPTPIPTVAPESGGGAKDNDGDGFKSDVDCDDKNAKIHPGAAETAKDGVDSNCDGKDDS